MASEQNHPWCRDVSRDDAIRAAEDDAANWRRLELGEAIKEGDEYLPRGCDWVPVHQIWFGEAVKHFHLPIRRRRVPPPDHRDLPSAVHDLRRRVEGLEAVADAWRRQCEAEADAENREAAPGSRDGVTAAPAANAGGEDVVVVPQTVVAGNFAQIHWNTCCRLHRMAMDKAGVRWKQGGAEFAFGSLDVGANPLHAAPAANAGDVSAAGEVSGDGKSGSEETQPPRGWLTSEERKAVGDAATALHQLSHYKLSLALRALLARETPPRGCIYLSKEDCESLYLARAVLDGVFVGSWQEKHDAARRLVSIRERARREAGGEVQDG